VDAREVRQRHLKEHELHRLAAEVVLLEDGVEDAAHADVVAQVLVEPHVLRLVHDARDGALVVPKHERVREDEVLVARKVVLDGHLHEPRDDRVVRL
jgi:hypothetical protein